MNQFLKRYPNPIRILLTAYSDINTVIDAINKGAIFKYVNKPWNEQEIQLIIETAYESYELKRRNKILLKKISESF